MPRVFDNWSCGGGSTDGTGLTEAQVLALEANTTAITELQSLDLTYDLITDDTSFTKEDIEKFGGRVLHRFDLTAKSIVVSYADDIPEGTQIDHVVSVVADGHTLTTSIGDGSNFPMHDVIDDVDTSDPVLVVDSVGEYSIEKQVDKGRVIRDDVSSESETKIVWSGVFDDLGGFDRGRWLLFSDNTYTNVAPSLDERVFKSGNILKSITVSNKGSHDITGISFFADNDAVSPIASVLDHQLTGAFSVLSGQAQEFNIVDGAPELSADMLIAFNCKNIYGPTQVDICFSFFNVDSMGASSASASTRNAQALAEWEFSGGAELAVKISQATNKKTQSSELVRDGSVSIAQLSVSQERNVKTFSENAEHASYVKSNVVIGDSVNVHVDGSDVELKRMTSGGFGSIVYTAAVSDLVVGNRYIASAYYMKATDGDDPARFWMRANGNPAQTPGHGQRSVSNVPKRIWTVLEAVTTTRLGHLVDPQQPMSAQGNRVVYWYNDQLFTHIGKGQDVYAGGFQLENIGNQNNDGIIVIGDSTMSGVGDYPAFSSALNTAGNTDDYRSLEVSRWIETELNANVFNRAIGGNDMDQIAARWAADVSPIAAVGNAKYVIIQGGINDIRKLADAGSTDAVILSTMQARIESLEALARADGLSPVFLTITPSPSNYSNRNVIRRLYNDWLMQRFALVIDINRPIESVDNETIIKSVNYFNDGVHYGDAAKEAIGKYIAAQPFWSLPRPSQYMPVLDENVPTHSEINVGGAKYVTGVGSPEGVVAAPVGSTYGRTDGGVGSALYVKEVGVGNTGWGAK